jgi:hypothetical protein
MFDCVFTSGRLKNLFCYQVDGKEKFVRAKLMQGEIAIFDVGKTSAVVWSL